MVKFFRYVLLVLLLTYIYDANSEEIVSLGEIEAIDSDIERCKDSCSYDIEIIVIENGINNWGENYAGL